MCFPHAARSLDSRVFFDPKPTAGEDQLLASVAFWPMASAVRGSAAEG